MDKEKRPIDCKYYATPQCPNRKALREHESSLVSETPGGIPINKLPVIEQAKRICAECKSFEPKE